MRSEQFDREERIEPKLERIPQDRADASLGDLVRQLTNDTRALVRSEIALAKAEMREMGATLATDLVKIGAGASLVLAGMLALTTFLVIGLGLLIGSFWASALIIGALFVGMGAWMARNAVNDIKRRGLKPEQTTESLRADAAWAKHEAREFKHELTK